jgi:hypothetical protein
MSSWNTTTLDITTDRPGHIPIVGHTRHRRQLRLDDELRKKNMLGLPPTESSAIHQFPGIVAIGTLHRSSDFTASQQSTKELIGHVRDRLTKSKPRPKLYSPHHCYQTIRSAPGQQPRPQALLHRSPSKVNSETMPLRRRNTQNNTFIARSQGSKVSFQSRNRERWTHILLDDASNKVMTPTGVTIIGSSSGTSSGAASRNFPNRPTSTLANIDHLPYQAMMPLIYEPTSPERRSSSPTSSLPMQPKSR